VKEIYEMSALLATAGRFGGIVALIALLIVLVKQLIVLVGFIMFALKIAIVIAFVGVMLLIVITFLTARNRRRREDAGL
jgi:predicted membrane protein